MTQFLYNCHGLCNNFQYSVVHPVQDDISYLLAAVIICNGVFFKQTKGLLTAVRLCDCVVYNTEWLNNTKGLKYLQSSSTKPRLFKCFRTPTVAKTAQ